MTNHEVNELSLLGLFDRIAEIDRIKTAVNFPTEKQEALLSSETAAKRAVAELLQEVAEDGMHGDERQQAKAFLKKQTKDLDPDARGYIARKSKIQELLAGVIAAPTVDEPAHVLKARQAIKHLEKAYKEAHETHEKWEKGRITFPSVSELTAMKKRHDDAKKALDAANAHLKEQLLLREGDGGLPAAVVAATKAAAKAKPKPGAPPPPTVRSAPATAKVAAAGYPSAARPKAPSNPVTRQAAPMAVPPDPPQPPVVHRAPRPRAEEPPVLSYACTLRALKELCGVSADQARELSSTANGFQDHLEEDAWEAVVRRALDLEKEQKEKEKQKERIRKEKALERVTKAVLGEASPKAVPGKATAGARPVAAQNSRSPNPPNGQQNKTPVPKTKPKVSGKALVGNNKFASFANDDDDDSDENSDSDDGGGWAEVKRR